MYMLYNLVPTEYKNVFSKEEYFLLYKYVYDRGLDKNIEDNAVNYFNKVPDFGYISTGFDEQEIINKIIKIAELIFNEKFDLPMVHFARYTNKSGAKPELAPHVDVFLEYPSYTMSIQLNTTKPNWIIRVDDYSYCLEKNSLITFSGTHQVHSRDLINFNDDDYCDILVCQFKSKNNFLNENLKNNEEHKKIIDLKFKDHIKKYRV